MIVLYLGFILVSCVMLMFSYTYQFSGINRVLLSPPSEVFESSVPLTIQKEEIVLYYDQEKLKENYENYLIRELTKYTSKYEVEYYFYNTNDGGFCDIENCSGVEIKVEAEVMLGINLTRIMNYEIKESEYYGKRSVN